MNLFRHFITVVCLVVPFIARAGEPPSAIATGAANQPIAAELEPLQGTWEGGVVDDKGTSKTPDSQDAGKQKPGEVNLDFLKPGGSESPPQTPAKITITVTGNSFHFYRDKNFWFETTITLPADTNPKQLHATIKGCPPSQSSSLGQVVVAIFKIEDGTLTLATGNGDGEAPKSFEATRENGLNRYDLRKVLPQKQVGELPQSK